MNGWWWLLLLLGGLGAGLSGGGGGGGDSIATPSAAVLSSGGGQTWGEDYFSSSEDESSPTPMSYHNTDYGDAPPPYGIASHSLQEYDWLGEKVSKESSYGGAGWEDTFDDGVSWSPLKLVPGRVATITFIPTAFNAGDNPASWHQYVKIWIDWDQSGSWEDSEKIVYWHRYVEDLAPHSLFQEVVTLDFLVPPDAELGTTWLRARLGRGWNFGPASDIGYGECEDYPVEIVPEPATVGLLGIGFAFLLVGGKERKRKRRCGE